MNILGSPPLPPTPVRAPEPSTDTVLDFAQIFGILKRGWWIIMGGGFMGTLIAVVLVLQITPSYTSSAKLLLGQKGRIDDAMGAMFPDLQLDAAAVSGEIAILTSSRLLSQVSETLELHSHPEFNPALTPEEEGPGLAERATDIAIGVIKRAMGQTPAPTAPAPTEPQEPSTIQQAALTGKTVLGAQADYVGTLAAKLKVSQQGRSNLLSIRFVSTDRLLAAAVPNTLVDLYLRDQIDRRFGVLSHVTSELEVRLETMRARLETSERAVIEYRNQNLADGFGNRAQLDQQLGDLLARLSAIRAENAELASDLEGIDTMIATQGTPATAGLFASPLIDSLREDLAQLQERATRLGALGGGNNQQMARLNAEITRVETSLTNEVRRLRDDRARTLALGERRAAALQTEVRSMEQRVLRQAEREVQLAQLKREQNAARVVYETFLDRFSETREVVDYQEGDAQIIGYADPPKAPFAPNKKLSAVLGGVAGGFLGVALVFILHLTRNTVSTVTELERVLPGYPVVAMPRVWTWFRRADPLRMALRSFPSPLSEAVRTLRSTVLLADPANAPFVVSVVSPQSGAGKTTTAINLARSIARAGRSCVLVDADLRRSGVARQLALKPSDQSGDPTPIQLHNFLTVPGQPLEAALQKDRASELHVITAERNIPDPGSALLSKELTLLIATLKRQFDVVIFDTAPLLNSSDAMPLIQGSDAVILVVSRGSPVEDIRMTADKVDKFAKQNCCAVLNYVPEKDVATYY